MLHSSAGLIVLLGATVLAIYKPRGLTRYGWRKAHGASLRPPRNGPGPDPPFRRAFLDGTRLE